MNARPFLKSLEGIRAYAFLMVFLVHFSGSPRLGWSLTHRSPVLYPWLLAVQLSFIAVPIFFALSGYLITGILFDTQDRVGYLATFYLRRCIRVFPLYYVTLGVGGAVAAGLGFHFRAGHLLYLVYLHNWSADGTLRIWGQFIKVSHLWSLAVEEQFYLIWPLVILTLRGRRQVLNFCYTLVGVSFLARFAYPLLHMAVFQVYESTFFRCDAIMLGSALALHQRGPMQSLARFVKPATAIVSGGLVLMVGRAFAVGQALPYDYFGVVVLMPVMALIGAGVVVLAIQPGNAVYFLAERGWAVALGKLSYSLYVLHELLAPLWEARVIPMLSHHLGRGGRVVGVLTAFLLVYVTARLTYQLFELPGIRLKGRFRYGKLSRLEPDRGTLAFLVKVTS